MCSDLRCCDEVEAVWVKVKTTHDKHIFIRLAYIGLFLLIRPILIVCFKNFEKAMGMLNEIIMHSW